MRWYRRLFSFLGWHKWCFVFRYQEPSYDGWLYYPIMAHGFSRESALEFAKFKFMNLADSPLHYQLFTSEQLY